MSTTSFSDAFAIFYAAEVERTAAFYKSLGFRETYRFPADGVPGFIALSLGATRLGVGAPPAHVVSTPSAAAEMCLYTHDVDAAVTAFRADGVRVAQEPMDQPWGERNAYVEDPDGRPIHLAMRNADGDKDR